MLHESVRGLSHGNYDPGRFAGCDSSWLRARRLHRVTRPTFGCVSRGPFLALARPARDAVDAPLREGEADFVVFHLDYGLLVLEVKGGAEMFAKGHLWFRKLASGERQIANPFEQARRNMHALNDAVAERTAGRITCEKYVYAYAVVFPHGRASGALPLDVANDILIDVDRMHEFERMIVKAFMAFPRKAGLLSRADYVEMLDVLLPRFQIMRPLSPQIESGRERLVELTLNQALAFRGLFSNRQLLVEGVAGSGKTLLAVERALAFARKGVRCLFICYNKELATWIREQLAGDPDRAPVAKLVDVYHFHALAAELAKEAGLPFEIQPARPKHDNSGTKTLSLSWRPLAPAYSGSRIPVMARSSSTRRRISQSFGGMHSSR